MGVVVTEDVADAVMVEVDTEPEGMAVATDGETGVVISEVAATEGAASDFSISYLTGVAATAATTVVATPATTAVANGIDSGSGASCATP